MLLNIILINFITKVLSVWDSPLDLSKMSGDYIKFQQSLLKGNWDNLELQYKLHSYFYVLLKFIKQVHAFFLEENNTEF